MRRTDALVGTKELVLSHKHASTRLTTAVAVVERKALTLDHLGVSIPPPTESAGKHHLYLSTSTPTAAAAMVAGTLAASLGWKTRSIMWPSRRLMWQWQAP